MTATVRSAIHLRRVLAGLSFGVLALAAGEAAAATDPQNFESIERGRYLAVAADCAACHTAPGGKPFAGGLALETPFGRLVTPNITPDRETGIGAWTDDEFVNALQAGTGRGGEHLYPAMPYGYYTKMSRQDALTIRDYLASLEPVSNPIQSNQLPFPFNVRASLVAWKALFFKSGRFEPDLTKPEVWNRGAYLVDALEHCGMCHTGKNMLGGDEQSRALQGGLLQDWYSPDLTGDPRTGLKSWSEEDVVTYLKTGTNRFTAATGPMAEAVERSTSSLTDGDLRAIAAYLKSLPAPSGASAASAPAPVAADNPSMRTGQAIYSDNCAACHGPTGTGIAGLFPVLKASPSVQSSDPTNLIRIVLRGTRAAGTGFAPTAPAMPALSWKLSDGQIAAVTTYVRNAWGNAAPAVSADQVAKLRQNLARQAD